jgi:hypothetical protein
MSSLSGLITLVSSTAVYSRETAEGSVGKSISRVFFEHVELDTIGEEVVIS